MQFVITATDHPDAASRRASARPAHLARIYALTMGRVFSGGALLDLDGKPIGSSMHVEFEDRAALDDWLAADPYVTEQVWDRVEIRRFRQADLTLSEQL